MLTNDIISEEANSADENSIGQLLQSFENEVEIQGASNKRELKDYRVSKREEGRITVKKLRE